MLWCVSTADWCARGVTKPGGMRVMSLRMDGISGAGFNKPLGGRDNGQRANDG